MDAFQFDALTRSLAAPVSRRKILAGFLVGLLSTGVQSTRAAENEFDFEPLLLPIPAGNGYIKNGGPDGGRHPLNSGDTNAIDVCQCTQDTWGHIDDPVLAPTDIEWVWSIPEDSTNNINNVPGDGEDFHFFQIDASSTHKLCLSFGHFHRVPTSRRRNDREFYPRGSPVGALLNYAAPNGNSIPHIHMGLFTVPSSGACKSKAGRISVPFTGDFSLDGKQYAAGKHHEEAVISHNVQVGIPKPGGVWVSAEIEGDTLTLQARAYPSNPGDPAVQHVQFTLWWPEVGPRQGPWKVACDQQAPSSGDTYTCTVDLGNLGVSHGSLDVSFDVYDVDGSYRLAPNGVRTVEYAEVQQNAGCSPGESICGNECSDIQTNTRHCGGCGQTCGIFQICCNGRCGCDPTVMVPFWCFFADYTCPEPDSN